ncbi:MAG: transposase [Trichodesmium erythraeum GBRTRLIN201]|nr:transposase [Trichodesmium erythraeum GBRTRLIN201]
MDSIFYVQRTRCQWEMIPHDLPPYTTVYRQVLLEMAAL